jgi:hypothetical protein
MALPYNMITCVTYETLHRYCGDVGNVADVSEIHAAFISRVDVFLLYFMIGES